MKALLVCAILLTGLNGAENTTADLNGATYIDQNAKSIRSEMIINAAPQQMPGWPKTMGVNPSYSPSGVALVDIDNNGSLDIIAGSTNNMVYAWDYHGSALTGWPITLPAMVQAKVAIGDLDNNGDQEIVIACRNGYVYVYNHDGTVFPGWPQNANGVIGFVSPALFDLDRDGDLEVIMVQMQSGQPGHVYIWHHNGTVYTGWPKDLDYLGVATASVADIDNDALFEIVALSYRSVYVWDQNGNTEPGWPKLNVAGGMSYAQPVLADLDNDGDLEILHSYYLSNVNYVGIYHHNASNFSGWPQTFPGPQTYTTPVTGDIDGDGDLEIFGGGHVWGGPNLLARHHTGGQVPGWPVNCEMMECSPIILDVDNDGAREVVIGDNLTAGNLWAYEGNGSVVTDWPVSLTGSASVNSPAAGDVDNDGDIEIALVTNDGAVNLWTLDSVPYKGYMSEWGTFFHDAWNTGWFHPKAPVNLSASGASDHINLIWAKNKEPDIAGYNIYRSQITGGPYTKVNAALVADTFYADYSAGPGILYYYCATANIKALAESRLSNEASAMIGIEEADGVSGSVATSTAAPNPFSASIRFASKAGEIISVRILNASGAVVAVTDDPQWIPDRSMPNGVYFAEIETSYGKEIKKIVKTR
jgi:hypothetical protein